MLMRYAMLIGAATAAVLAAVNLGGGEVNMVLVGAGQGLPQAKTSLWLLALAAALITLSLCRFVIFGLPSMMDEWYRDNKSWLFVAAGGSAICGLMYLT